MSKDSTRSIRLDGDVAHIAQKLADDKMLSHTLSKLLRQHYGLNTKIDAMKAELDLMVNQRMQLQESEKILADKIDAAEQEFLNKQTTELPVLREKLDHLLKLHSQTKQRQLRTGISQDTQLQNQLELINNVSKQIAELEL
tara:strand:+ start:719 stop:1141 length:423 start_codon:yes stop_codon:yes gene_type:complete